MLVRIQNAAVALGVMTVLSACGSDDPRPAPETSTPASTPGNDASVVPSESPPPRRGGGPALPEIDLDELRTREPSAEVDIAIGNVFFSRGELDSALGYYRSAIDREPDDPSHLNYLGICLARMGRTAEAQEAYQKAEELDPYYVKTYVNQGNIFFGHSEYEKAISAYNVAVSIDSTDATAWINLGMAYEKTEQFNKAIEAYNKAAECDPFDPKPWENLGWIYYEKKLYHGARERWQEAIERDPTREDLKENVQRLMDYAESTGTR